MKYTVFSTLFSEMDPGGELFLFVLGARGLKILKITASETIKLIIN